MRYFPDVIILYEHKARELYSCYLLKYELKKRGINAIVCHNSFRHTWWIRLVAKPKIVISLGALLTEIIPNWSVMDQHSSFLRCRPRYYINLQVEQMFREEDAKYNIVTKKEYQDLIYYVCWSNRRKQQAIRQGISEKKLWVTGAVHLDFCRHEFDSIFFSKKELAKLYKIENSKKWVLFISSFPYVTYTKKELAWGEKIQNDCLKHTQKTNMDNLKKKAIDTYLEILNWIDSFLAETQFIFIYRPHPGERTTNKIKNIKSKYPNRFFFIMDGNIHQWIRACDVVDTWVSTAYSETIFLDKKCNIVQPYGAPSKFEPVFYPEDGKIKSYTQFVRAHDECEKQNNEHEKERLCNYYAFEKKPAYKAICDNVEKLYIDKNKCYRPERGKVIRYLFSRTYLLELYVSFTLCFCNYIDFFCSKNSKLGKLNRKIKKGGDIYNECYFTKKDKIMIEKIKKIILS